jgi:hypothetical protein
MIIATSTQDTFSARVVAVSRLRFLWTCTLESWGLLLA